MISKPVISQDAKAIALVCCQDDWWIKNKVAFTGVKTDRDLLIKRLSYWLEHMEGDINHEAPLTASIIRSEAISYFDWVIQEAERRTVANAVPK